MINHKNKRQISAHRFVWSLNEGGGTHSSEPARLEGGWDCSWLLRALAGAPALFTIHYSLFTIHSLLLLLLLLLFITQRARPRAVRRLSQRWPQADWVVHQIAVVATQETASLVTFLAEIVVRESPD